MRKLLLLCFTLTLTNLMAQDSALASEIDVTTLSKKDVYKQIDRSIEARDEVIIEFMGMLGVDFPNYSEFEEYILDMSEELIQTEDLAYPLKLVEAVLYNNLENTRAQELYTIVIDKQIEIAERIEAEKRKAELNRVTLESEEVLIIEEQLKEEENITRRMDTVKDLSSVISSFSDSFHKTHYISNSHIYPIYFRHYYSEVYDNYIGRDATNNVESGFAIDVGLGIDLNSITIRMDASGAMSYDELINNVERQIFSSGIFSLGFSFIPVPLFFRAGFYQDIFIFEDEEDVDTAITNLPSPSLGVGITGLRLFKVLKLDLSTDYLLASTYTENLDLSFLVKSYVSVNMYRTGALNFELKTGFDYLYLKEGGLKERSIMPKFGFGVSNYE